MSANPIMSRPMLSRLRSPPLSGLFHRAAHERTAPLVEPEFDQLAVDAPGALAARKVRRAQGGGEGQVFLDGELFVEGVVLRDVGDVAAQVVEAVVRASGR